MLTLALKAALFVFLLYLGIRLAKKALKKWFVHLLGQSFQGGSKQEKSSHLQACSHCGTQVAVELGKTRNGNFYCSQECAKKGPKL